MNFYLSGPRYDGVLPPCDHRLRSAGSPRFNPEGKPVLEQRSQDRISSSCADRFRSWRQRHSAPLLQRHRRISDGRKHPIHYRSPRTPA
jgi:hypothetical protein